MSILERIIDARGEQKSIGELLRDPSTFVPALKSLSFDEALAALSETAGDPNGIDVDASVATAQLDLVQYLTGAQARWAHETLETWAKTKKPMPSSLAAWAFIALGRGGGMCPRAWERLFPSVHGGGDDPSVRWVIEAARALPKDRVHAVGEALMTRSPESAASTALALLTTHDDEALARDLLAHRSEAWSAERVRGAVAKLPMRPGIQRALAADDDTPALVLKVIATLSPKRVEELAPIQRQQLETAGNAYEGKRRPAATRLADTDDEASFGGECEWRVLADASDKPRYDAWLYAGDGGMFFEAGTVRVVAERIQGGVSVREGAPAGLARALEEATGLAKAAVPAKVVPTKVVPTKVTPPRVVSAKLAPTNAEPAETAPAAKPAKASSRKPPAKKKPAPAKKKPAPAPKKKPAAKKKPAPAPKKKPAKKKR